jgi:diacylglycerol kinase (ATP)
MNTQNSFGLSFKDDYSSSFWVSLFLFPGIPGYIPLLRRKQVSAMYSDILLICNGKAGQGKLEALLKDTIPPLLDVCTNITIHPTKDKGDAERFCREKGRSFDLVIVLGGDGTVHEVINGLADLNERPLTAILPGGTCNDFARSLHIPMNIKQAVQLIVEHPLRKSVDLVKTDDRYFSNFWGTGLISQASDNIDVGSKGVLGKLSYYISAFQSIQDAPIMTVKVKTDEEEFEEEVVMVLAANGKSIGANALPQSISLEDGLLDLYLVKRTGFPLLKEFFLMKGTGDVSHTFEDIRHIRTSSLEVELSEEEKFDMDGELYDGKRQTMKVLPGHMDFIVGVEG